MRIRLFAVVFLAFYSLLAAQQALNNGDVIKMVKAGLSEDLILSTVNSSSGTYDTSTDALIALKKAGVSDKVVAAMVAKNATPSTSGQPGASAEVRDSDDPASPHDPGVYLLSTAADGKRKMVFIDRTGAGREKTHRRNMMAEIPGPRAAVRTTEEKPTFYMYFPSNVSLSDVESISSPTQFSLLSLEQKKDHRETAISHIGFWHVTVGTEEKKSALFASERIRPFVYKLTPNNSMKPGEYAFIATTSVAGSARGATVVIYDFGIDAK